jgi:hypothetical protein
MQVFGPLASILHLPDCQDTSDIRQLLSSIPYFEEKSFIAYFGKIREYGTLT